MDLPFLLIDMVLHFDKYLPGIIETYGFWTYVILFVIIFCETGLVVAPYLPGDSLLFVAGALAGAGLLNIEILILSLIVAAVLGDSANYWIGHTTGMKVLDWKCSFVKKEHLEQTHEYFKKYGGFTIVIARFVPFIRTFAPFLAGVGKMSYRWFLRTISLAVPCGSVRSPLSGTSSEASPSSRKISACSCTQSSGFPSSRLVRSSCRSFGPRIPRSAGCSRILRNNFSGIFPDFFKKFFPYFFPDSQETFAVL